MRTILVIIAGFIAGIMSVPASAQWGWNNSTNPNSGVYGNQGAMRTQNVQMGVVVQIRPVRVEPSQTAAWTGRGAGAALGGVVGSKIGKGSGRTAAMILAGLAGAVAGDAATDALAGHNAQEIIVAMEPANGGHAPAMMAVTQAGSALQPGMKVFVIGDGWSGMRVVPAI